MSYNYAVVGATGNVGREIIQILAERGIPAGAVTAVASERSVGAEVSYGDDDVLKVHKKGDSYVYSRIFYKDAFIDEWAKKVNRRNRRRRRRSSRDSFRETPATTAGELSNVQSKDTNKE